MTAYPGNAGRLLQACASGRLPPNVALMHMIASAGARDDIDALLGSPDALLAGVEGQPAVRLSRLSELWREAPQSWELIRGVLAEVGKGERAGGATDWRAVFERTAAISPDGSASLYLLGREDLSRAATDSIVARLMEWELVDASSCVLDLGCGAGRLAEALADHAGEVVGFDISPAMLSAARQRCAGLPNVMLHEGTGADLAIVEDEEIDLVLACDVFPYVVDNGEASVQRHFQEASRVLSPGGHLVILNYSYRGDDDRDLADIEQYGARAGLRLQRVGEGQFEHWDGRSYVLGKSRKRIALERSDRPDAAGVPENQSQLRKALGRSRAPHSYL